jgi:hypothetical protein
MQAMQQPNVIRLKAARRRAASVERAVEARRRLRPAERRHGRMWLNGVQLGAGDPALAHLSESYD